MHCLFARVRGERLGRRHHDVGVGLGPRQPATWWWRQRRQRRGCGFGWLWRRSGATLSYGVHPRADRAPGEGVLPGELRVPAPPVRAGRCAQPARNHHQGMDSNALPARASPRAPGLICFSPSPPFFSLWVVGFKGGPRNPRGLVTKGAGFFISPMPNPKGWQAWLTWEGPLNGD